MKTLLGKVKTLLNDSKSKKDSSSEKKALTENQDKISSVTSSAKTGQLYGVLGDIGDMREKQGEKSVNVISIPLNALTKISKSKNPDDDRDSGSDTTLDPLEDRQRNSQRFFYPDQIRAEDDEDRDEVPSFENKRRGPFLPVMIANPGERDLGGRMMLMNPITRTLRHDDITRKHSKDDDGLYRDIGHIPGESARLLGHGSTGHGEDVGKTTLRHKNPGHYYHNQGEDKHEDAYHNQGKDKHEPDNYGYDDDDDDHDDDVNDDHDASNNRRMQAEAREIASSRNRLFSMLPGNDPTYTSENRGLGIRAGYNKLPESFLGNPMLFGMGFNNQKNMLPMNEEAMAGEHADNSNGRDVFMMGNQGTRQVYTGASPNMEDNPMQTPSLRINNNAFNLGGSQAQAMSPNEVSYRLEKQGFLNELSQKNHISRPKGAHQGTTSANVLIKVNGKPIGDSKDLRDHVVNGRVFRGKEKIIKSKGPMDVKIARVNDGVHSKVVDITSSEKVKVLETKSKIMRNH